jgi:hypothetical protein
MCCFTQKIIILYRDCELLDTIVTKIPNYNTEELVKSTIPPPLAGISANLKQWVGGSILKEFCL